MTNNDDSYGHFKYGDVPKEITKMHTEFQKEQNYNEYYFFVSWKP